MASLLTQISVWIIQLIAHTGYWGIAFLMFLDSANLPVPSEIVMPFSGFWASQGFLTLWGITIAGTVGATLGSWLSYEFARYVGRPFLEKWGKFFLIRKRDLDHADALFAKHGPLIVFVGRFIPFVRSFISLPAGIAEMNRPKFFVYTIAGTLPWIFIWSYLGFVIGGNWHIIGKYFWIANVVVLVALLGGIAWWIAKHMRLRRQPANHS